VALFLFGLLITVHRAFYSGEELAGADRLVTRNKVSLIMPLPLSYAERIRQVPGVEDVTFANWFGAYYQDPRNQFANFAIDSESFARMYPEYVVPPEGWKAYMADREGCVVGRSLADRFGWKVGDRVPLQGTIWVGTWEFNVRAIYTGRRPDDDTTQFWFHWKYLEERRPWGKGQVGWYVIRATSPDEAASVAAAVDERFANSPWETTTQTEKAFATGFIKQFGNIRLLILVIGSVVFFTLLLVTGNTMAIAVRERTGELAVLKTVGFSDRTVLLLVLAEGMLIALAGGAIGISAARIVVPALARYLPMLPSFHLPAGGVAAGLGVSAAAGLLAGFLPAVDAMRLRIVDALRRA
jgi:putative ABC transport system permease protein